MNNIKREFLYSDHASRYVPVQLLASAYGVAEVNPIDRTDVTTFDIEIRFPSQSSNLVFLLDYNSKDVVQVYASPPGTVNVIVTIEEGKSYSVYVVSKEYKDGFIDTELSVLDPDPYAYNPFEFNMNRNPPQVIDLSDKLTPSEGRDDEDPTQWFDYRGYYSSPTLVWENPVVGDLQLRSKNYWLIYRQEILVQLDNIFSQVNLRSFNINSKSDSIKMLKVMDLIAEFMRDKKDYYEDALGDDASTVENIWDFLNQNLPGYQYNELEYTGERYYWAFDEGLSDIVDAIGVYADYIRWDGFDAMGGDDPQNIPNSRDQQGRYVAATNMGLDHGYSPRAGIELDLAGLDDNDRHKGTFKGGQDARSYLAGGWDTWPWQEQNPGFGDGDLGDATGGLIDALRRIIGGGQTGTITGFWGLLWGQFQVERVPWIRYWNQRIGDVYGLPIHPEGEGDTLTAENRAWWGEVIRYCQSFWNNIRPWLDEQITENQELIIAAGDSLFSGYTWQENIFIGYGDWSGNTSTPRPEWFTVTVPWTLEKYNQTQRTYVIDSQGTYSADELWRMALGDAPGNKPQGGLRESIIPVNRLNWNSTTVHDLDGDDYYTTGGGRLPTESWHLISDFRPVTEIINVNQDKIWPPIYETRSGGTITIETGTTQPTGSTFPLAYEAILQNIRFVKNLIESVDENLWAALTNSSALMLSTAISIRDTLAARPETHSILNVTNSTVKSSNIEVGWKRVSPYDSGLQAAGNWAKEWNDLPNPLIEIGDGTYMLNLNSNDFDTVGKYVFTLKPAKFTVNVASIDGDFVVILDELNDYQNKNAFYGWNAQLYKATGEIVGGQKIIVESEWAASRQYLKLQPQTDGLPDIQEDHKIDIWSNEFIPVIVEVDIVEHNALTLSYAQYGKKELNTDTGLCTIYDYAGNVYKVLSFGKYSNATVNGAIIEYRIPEEDPNKP